MADAYVVTAPYVTPRVRDDVKGGYVHRGFYKGAVIRAEDIEPESLRHHLDGDMMAEAPSDAPAPEPEPRTDNPAEQPPPGGDPTKPPQAASKPEWVAFAVSQRAEGVSEEDARKAAEAKSKAELIAEFGG